MGKISQQILQVLAALPLAVAAFRPGGASAQAPGTSPAKVDTKGLAARIRFEHEVAGYLTELNGRYKLRVTELTLAPAATSASTTTSGRASG